MILIPLPFFTFSVVWFWGPYVDFVTNPPLKNRNLLMYSSLPSKFSSIDLKVGFFYFSSSLVLVLSSLPSLFLNSLLPLIILCLT